jgi:putative SOS response-associated peptidase YedK
MCNLYSLTKGQAAIRDWFRAKHDRTGNLPLFPGIFPDHMAPIVRTGADGERELVIARWGMPGPPQYGGAPVTNIRNLSSPHWRGWLGPQNRCIVPATSFCEYADTKPRKTPIWFALAEARPLFAFAGLWASWRGVRGPKSAPVEGDHQLFGFLTTRANAIVAPIHPKAMPVILTTPAEFERQPAAGVALERGGGSTLVRRDLLPCRGLRRRESCSSFHYLSQSNIRAVRDRSMLRVQ